jgi:hypothetical protein
MSKIDEIIKVISLANSSKREETIINLVKYSIYKLGNFKDISEISTLIKTEFHIEIFIDELKECVEKIDLKNITKKLNGEYYANNDFKIKIKYQIETQEKKSNELFEKFIAIVDGLSEVKLELSKKNKIVQTYLDYLYECFYHYGVEIANQFKLTNEIVLNNDDEKNKEIVRRTISKLDDNSIKVFKKMVSEIPKCLSSEDIEYIESLVNKAESFLSLGLSKELYEELMDLDMIDWFIFLDTNYLYSVLDLNIHPEKDACIKFIDICQRNNFKIKFYYLPQTLKELKKKRSEVENMIPKANYSVPQLNALVKSKNIDGISKRYYEKKLENKDTPHPTEIIDMAATILKTKSINIYNGSFDELNEDNNLKKKINKYNNFIGRINDYRKNRKQKPVERNPDKIEHDTFFREAILSLRKNDAINLNDVKYFGITLDHILLKYDKNEHLYKFSENYIPTFFSPSFLLSKLIKLSPIVTDDYRFAYLNAISSHAFSSDIRKSIIVQKSVKYFNSLGIDDEKLILRCISDDIFLQEFHKKEGTDELEKFIINKIQLEIRELRDEKNELEKSLKDKEKVVDEKTEKEKIKDEEIVKKDNDLINLNKRLESLENDIIEFKKENVELKKNEELTKNKYLKEKVEKNEKDEEISNLLSVNVDLIEYQIKSEIGKWRRPVYYICFPILIFSIISFILTFWFQESDINYVVILINFLDKIQTNSPTRNIILFLGFSILFLTITIPSIVISWQRLFSKRKRKKYLESLPLSCEFTDKNKIIRKFL